MFIQAFDIIHAKKGPIYTLNDLADFTCTHSVFIFIIKRKTVIFFKLNY